MPVASFEIGRLVKTVMRCDNRIFRRRGVAADFCRRPHVELAFLVLGVGIQGRVITALRRLHFAHDPAGGFDCNALEERISCCPPGIGIQAQQRPVVVEHFLEMRDRPALVHAVAAKAAA